MRQVVVSAVGAVMSLAGAAAASNPQTLVSFSGTNGSAPQGQLVADAAGNLYGTAQSGGHNNKGTVFEVSPPAAGKKAWTTRVLFNFNGTNGSQPVSGLVFDTAGNLYGTALAGGALGDGDVFELVKPASGHTNWTIKILTSFKVTDGRNPQAGVIFDTAGKLYGATISGGSSNAGTVFRLSPPSAGQAAWQLTTLFAFNGTSHGANPTGTLIMDKSGNIYGTTVNGGSAKDGVAFELSPPASGTGLWHQAVLMNFGRGLGLHPYAGLVEDADGNLYGTSTSGGGQNHGLVFELPAASPGHGVVLAGFTGTNGAYPFANLTIDAAANLYGVTGGGGGNNQGTVYEVRKTGTGASGWTESVLTSFTGTNGSGPSAAVLLEHAGVIFGTTVNGGKNNDGTVFRLAF